MTTGSSTPTCVFQLWHPQDPLCTVDVFIRNPIAFEALWERAEHVDLDNTACRIVGIPDLIRMKTEAGRPQDLRDIEELERIVRLNQRGAT